MSGSGGVGGSGRLITTTNATTTNATTATHTTTNATFLPKEVVEHIEKTGIFDSLRNEVINYMKLIHGDDVIRNQTERSIRKSSLLPTNLYHIKQSLIFTLSDNLKTYLKKDQELSRVIHSEIRRAISSSFPDGETPCLRDIILNEIRATIQTMNSDNNTPPPQPELKLDNNNPTLPLPLVIPHDEVSLSASSTSEIQSNEGDNDCKSKDDEKMEEGEIVQAGNSDSPTAVSASLVIVLDSSEDEDKAQRDQEKNTISSRNIFGSDDDDDDDGGEEEIVLKKKEQNKRGRTGVRIIDTRATKKNKLK